MYHACAVLRALAVVAFLGGVCHASPPQAEQAQVYEQQVRPFLAQHCFSCHGEEDGKAGLRLHNLSTNLAAGNNADTWKEVIDRINLGEMPPEDKPRPDAEQAFAVTQWVGRELKRTERESRMAGGQIVLRRMNRREYINTVRDMLSLDANFTRTLTETLPPDGKADGFDRLSAALFIDATQMDAYLAAAQQIADEAIVEGDQPPGEKIAFEAEEKVRPEADRHKDTILGETVTYPLGVHSIEIQPQGVLHIQDKFGNGRGPKLWARFESLQLDQLVTQDGYYRIRIRAGASRGRRGEPIRLRLLYADGTPIASETILPLEHRLEQPGIVEAMLFLRAGEPGQSRRLTMQWNGLEKVIQPNLKWQKTIKSPARAIPGKILAAKKAGDQQLLKQLYAEREELIRQAKAFNEPFFSYSDEYAEHPEEAPQLFFDSFEIEGPLHPSWPPASHRQLIGGPTPENADLALARTVIARLLPKAYRRPVSPEEIDRVVAVVDNGLARQGMNFSQAMRLGLQTILCAPQFLYIAEPAVDVEGPFPLGDYELATRLSYFLWSTMPDETLFDLAAKGQLQQPDVLREQVVRMLDDPRSGQFVESFAGQWLNVEEFGSVEVSNQYADYDPELQDASRQEALAFFAEVLASDLPITSFLDSDFLVINERLARHYGIPGVEGSEFRKVAITPDQHRGGIFGMAGLLTLLADGTRTLPVRRAAWIMENVFNDPSPPPPPNAGEIQPNTSGEKLTVRQRLALHRDEPTCASCHKRLDPFGLALENYDAIGAWRTHANGENFRRDPPELDVSGELPSGRRFENLNGFKTALLEERDRFAKAFSQKMLTYALGRSVGYVDHRTVDQLTVALQDHDYRLRSLIQAIVASEAFRNR
ncbi:DUF1592 domain-containing protein [Lignipirellula cremea]|uniref:Planctomycete cytochrome C n=1 Tax=Lignipirellula cremea TaxID=2528010 RepID=A0A518DRL3_9BACT|nr:DUF1592 domain-containing protein [Lignipirellula cremea]QDU94454.1 Planctomycete cytochrome C [Lignipirellula cremea]